MEPTLTLEMHPGGVARAAGLRRDARAVISRARGGTRATAQRSGIFRRPPDRRQIPRRAEPGRRPRAPGAASRREALFAVGQVAAQAGEARFARAGNDPPPSPTCACREARPGLWPAKLPSRPSDRDDQPIMCLRFVFLLITLKLPYRHPTKSRIAPLLGAAPADSGPSRFCNDDLGTWFSSQFMASWRLS